MVDELILDYLEACNLGSKGVNLFYGLNPYKGSKKGLQVVSRVTVGSIKNLGRCQYGEYQCQLIISGSSYKSVYKKSQDLLKALAQVGSRYGTYPNGLVLGDVYVLAFVIDDAPTCVDNLSDNAIFIIDFVTKISK